MTHDPRVNALGGARAKSRTPLKSDFLLYCYANNLYTWSGISQPYDIRLVCHEAKVTMTCISRSSDFGLYLEDCLMIMSQCDTTFDLKINVVQHDLYFTVQLFYLISGERGGSVVECRTPEREVRGSRPTAAVLCP